MIWLEADGEFEGNHAGKDNSGCYFVGVHRRQHPGSGSNQLTATIVTTLDDTCETNITACAKSLLNRQSLINTSTSITDIIMDRFDMGPNQAEPAGLELTNAKDILKRSRRKWRHNHCADRRCGGSGSQPHVEYMD